jgi:hypothetical protein
LVSILLRVREDVGADDEQAVAEHSLARVRAQIVPDARRALDADERRLGDG